MTAEPGNSDEVTDSGIPVELQSTIDDLNRQVMILDAQDQIKALKAQIAQRTAPIKPVQQWKHFVRVQHFYLGWKNGDAQEKTKYASTLTLILAVLVTFMAVLSGHVSIEAAALLNLAAGCFGKFGDWLAVNYSSTNDIPNSTYTYDIGTIYAKDEQGME